MERRASHNNNFAEFDPYYVDKKGAMLISGCETHRHENLDIDPRMGQ